MFIDFFLDVFARNAVKYQAREYRHAFWDSGTMIAHTLAMAAASLSGSAASLVPASLTPLSAPDRAQSAQQVKPEILVVGTYHMANPGRDIFNATADDVLSPKRQAEIAELLTVLKKFRPTKIAIESTVYDDTRKKQYADYLAGKHTLTRNEIEQVGFRLAKELKKNPKEIAFTFNVSLKTVENQRHSIMKKLDLFSIAELTKYAVRQGLTSLK